jgi:HEPN domain-containing protein
MSEHDKEIEKKVIQWQSFGDEDLQLARHAMAIKTKCPYRLIAYHAQQCAEKYLKALLVSRRIDFPYTHNISRLIELCPMSADWKSGIIDAEELSPFAVSARYPGEDEDVSKQEAVRALTVAEQVRKAVRAVLGKKS